MQNFTEINLQSLRKAGYDKNSEAAARIRIDYMIIACKLAYVSAKRLSQDSQVPQTAEDHSSTQPPLFGLPFKIYPEIDMSVEIEDRRKALDFIGYRVRVSAKWIGPSAMAAVNLWKLVLSS